jgi:multidrug efflux system membrane fusion protein
MNTTPFRTPRSSRQIYSAALILAAGFALAACRQAPPTPPPPQVTVAPAVQREVQDWSEFTGHFEAVGAVDVRPRVSGFVERVAFVEGATVNQGEVLFTIDRRQYEADVARAEAMLEQARTRKELADAELARAQRLVSTQAISREELDSRTSGRAEGDAAVRAAEASLRIARLNLEWTTVRAPISGRVGRAQVTPGNLVQAGPPAATLLTTIVSVDPIYVYFDTDEQTYLKNMAPGHTGNPSVLVGLANETGFPHKGRLDFIDNRVDQSAGTVNVRVVVRNDERRFAPGLFARVRLADGIRRRVTLVQDQAVGTDQDHKFVLVLQNDMTVAYRPITIGKVVDGLREVSSGLAAGERVVINGQMRVRPGMKVAATTAVMVAEAKATHSSAQ